MPACTMWPSTQDARAASAVAITALLFLVISYTKFGKALRAVSQNRELARVSGINANLVASATWFLAGLVAGYAGFILAESIGTFTPSFGFGFFLITLTAAVAGAKVNAPFPKERRFRRASVSTKRRAGDVNHPVKMHHRGVHAPRSPVIARLIAGPFELDLERFALELIERLLLVSVEDR